jgi:hypothetical protein
MHRHRWFRIDQNSAPSTGSWVRTRAMLVAAATQQWGVSADRTAQRKGTVVFELVKLGWPKRP